MLSGEWVQDRCVHHPSHLPGHIHNYKSKPIFPGKIIQMPEVVCHRAHVVASHVRGRVADAAAGDCVGGHRCVVVEPL